MHLRRLEIERLPRAGARVGCEYVSGRAIHKGPDDACSGYDGSVGDLGLATSPCQVVEVLMEIKAGPEPEKYHLDGHDYIDLWRYYEDRADHLKQNMFATITWMLGFASLLLGFLAERLGRSTSGPRVDGWDSPVLVGVAVSGLILCGYCVILLREHAEHIQRNWDRASAFRRQIGRLEEILSSMPPGPRRSRWQVWTQVGFVVCAFAVAFILVLGQLLVGLAVR